MDNALDLRMKLDMGAVFESYWAAEWAKDLREDIESGKVYSANDVKAVARFVWEAARKVLPSPSAGRSNACEWVEDENGTWETQCGNAFVLEAETPSENEMKFCAYCGKPLQEKPFRYPDEDEPTTEEPQ